MAGSLFYALPRDTTGLFTRGGALFFVLLFNSLLAMTEVTTSFDGRAILGKHKARLFPPFPFSRFRRSTLVRWSSD